MIWAFAKAGLRVPDRGPRRAFHESWRHAFLDRAQDFSAHGLANVVWSIAELEVSSDFLDGFVRIWCLNASKRLDHFTNQGLSNSLLGLAKLKLVSSHVFVETKEFRFFLEGAVIASQSRLGAFNGQDVSNTVMALVLLDPELPLSKTPFTLDLWRNAIQSLPLDQLSNPTHIEQIHQQQNERGKSSSWGRISQRVSAIPANRQLSLRSLVKP